MDRASLRFTWLFALSQLKLRYRYTALGFLWNLLEPTLYLGVLSLVFSVVNRMRLADYAVFLFSGLVPWRYFEKVVLTCMDSIVQGDWLLRKLPVSPFALPLTRWIVASAEFAFSFAALFLVLALIGHAVTLPCLVLPLAALPWVFSGLGLGLVCAALFTFFRDIRPVVQMGLLFAFFSAPILFRGDLFAEHSLQSGLLAWHPLTYLAALFQKPIYHATWPAPRDWAVSLATAGLSMLLGVLLVSRNRARFYFYL
jgi:ABC-type polysaccharide/polyol phosphate export permease